MVVTSEKRDTASKVSLVGDAGPWREGSRRHGRVPAQHLPDADATLDLREAVERSVRVGSVEVSEADITSRNARRLVERLQPLNLGEGIVGSVPGGVYVYGGDDVLIGGVTPIVIDEVISSDWPEIPQRLDGPSGGAKPRMPVHAQIPQMDMRVDDRSRIQFGHARRLPRFKLFSVRRARP